MNDQFDTPDAPDSRTEQAAPSVAAVVALAAKWEEECKGLSTEWHGGLLAAAKELRTALAAPSAAIAAREQEAKIAPCKICYGQTAYCPRCNPNLRRPEPPAVDAGEKEAPAGYKLVTVPDEAAPDEPNWEECKRQAEISTGLKVEQHTFSILKREVRRWLAHRNASSPESTAVDEGTKELLAYVLQDEEHNRLTPRVIDIAYTAFMLAKQPNSEDGGSSDWFSDTRPVVKKAIDKLRTDLAAPSAAIVAREQEEVTVTDAMVDAYLEANTAYWQRTDQIPPSPSRWITGTPREATREGLVAALASRQEPPVAVAVEKVDLPYLQERLQDFTCTRVENAGNTPGYTLYKTKLGAHPEYQLYADEAFALWVNLGKALGQQRVREG